LGNINIVENYELYALNGKKYLVLHGDIFDVFVNEMKWLAKIGSVGYDLTLWLNKWYNKYLLNTGPMRFIRRKIIGIFYKWYQLNYSLYIFATKHL
jgi:UDP-2,3-diacylglucosamine pyrophosphatase LpxH